MQPQPQVDKVSALTYALVRSAQTKVAFAMRRVTDHVQRLSAMPMEQRVAEPTLMDLFNQELQAAFAQGAFDAVEGARLNGCTHKQTSEAIRNLKPALAKAQEVLKEEQSKLAEENESQKN